LIFQAWYQTQLRGEVLDYLAELVNSGKIDPVINAQLSIVSNAQRAKTNQHANNQRAATNHYAINQHNVINALLNNAQLTNSTLQRDIDAQKNQRFIL
jgi:hypothetical protein